VIGGDPIPGNDWAKYLLYADEVAVHGQLLIDNPFWMLGVPFREDPGVPALYGSFLSLSGEPASTLAHGIWFFAIASILAVFAFVRALWGDVAGVIAAGLWAVLPISHDILAWHGAPNLAAICLLALLLPYLAVLTSERIGRGEAVGLGLVLVALAATHRLSALVGAMAIVVTLAWAIAAAEGGARRDIVRNCGFVTLAVLALSPGVLYDLIERARTFGGTQDYRAYLSAKVNLGPVVGDLSVIFTVLAVAALVFAVRLAGRDRAVAALLSLLAVVIALAYSWLLEIPTAYFRMAYYLPLAGPAPGSARRGTRLAGDRRVRMGPGIQRARLLRVHQRRVPPRPGRPERPTAAERGGGHGPLLELPGHLAASHPDAARART
jgi:hypothetical protein